MKYCNQRLELEFHLPVKYMAYEPGDIVTWDLMGSSPWHIGIVTNKISPKTNNPLIVHNIGRGPVIDDMIFSFPIRGHYRYIPEKE